MREKTLLIFYFSSLRKYHRRSIRLTFFIKKVQQFSIVWKGYIPESGARESQFQTSNNEPLDNELLYSKWYPRERIPKRERCRSNFKTGMVPFEFQIGTDAVGYATRLGEFVSRGARTPVRDVRPVWRRSLDSPRGGGGEGRAQETRTSATGEPRRIRLHLIMRNASTDCVIVEFT